MLHDILYSISLLLLVYKGVLRNIYDLTFYTLLVVSEMFKVLRIVVLIMSQSVIGVQISIVMEWSQDTYYQSGLDTDDHTDLFLLS